MKSSIRRGRVRGSSAAAPAAAKKSAAAGGDSDDSGGDSPRAASRSRPQVRIFLCLRLPAYPNG